MAVLGSFLETVRERFDATHLEDSFPYRWYADIKRTRIAIESAFNEDKEHRNFRPAVYVDCDDQTMGRVVLGDRAGRNPKKGIDGFWNLQSVPILIECVAAKRAESAIIGDLVGTFIQASSDLIQAKFGFHDLTPVTVGRTQPSGLDKNEWITSVTLVAQYSMRWTNEKTSPLLQEIETRVARSGAESATEYFERIALGTST